MADFGFIGPSYEAPSIYQDGQECINFRPEIDPLKQPGQRGVVSLYPTPGLTTKLVFDNQQEVRGLRAISGGEYMVAVVGAYVYVIDSTFTPKLIGQVNTQTGPVTISDNGINVYIVDNFTRYTWRISNPSNALFEGSISGTTLTVTLLKTGTISGGQSLFGLGVFPNTVILSQLTGTTGAEGTYLINVTQSIDEETMNSANVAATFTGYIKNTNLTVLSIPLEDTIYPGQALVGENILPDTIVTALGNGTVIDQTIATPGSGYAINDVVNLLGGVYGTSPATYTVSSVTVGVGTLGTIVPGSSYTDGTYNNVQLTYVSGATATTYPTADIVVSGNKVTSVTIVNQGTGFTATSTVLSANASDIGGTGSGFSVPVETLSNTGGVLSLILTDAGNYTSTPFNNVSTATTGTGTGLTLTVTFGTGTGGTGDYIVSTSQNVASFIGVATFDALVGGSGYADGTYANVQLIYDSGSTATEYPVVDIVVSGGAVTAVTIKIAGDGFANTSTVMTANPMFDGVGAGLGFTIGVATLTTLGETMYALNFSAMPFTDGAFNGGRTVDIVDNYFVYNEPNSQKWAATSPLSPITPPLSFSSKDGAPDDLVSIIVDHREVYLLGEQSSEVWIDVGSFPFPFQRIPGTSTQHGIAAQFSMARVGNSFAYVSRNNRGQAQIVQMNGYIPQRISTHAVEQTLLNQRVDDAVAWTYQQEGHECYVVSFPSLDLTWVYDVTTTMWHKWLWIDNNNVYHRHRGNCAALFQGKVYVGDHENGQLYLLDPSNYTDNGQQIRRLRRAPHIVTDLQRQYLEEFQIQFQPGVGITGTLGTYGAIAGVAIASVNVAGLGAPGHPQGVNPQAMLRWSNDGGSTWSNEHWTTIGAMGKYNNRAIWRRLGWSRDRVFEVVVTDPVNAVIISANLKASQGEN